MNAGIVCGVAAPEGEAGITMYMDEKHHYDLAISSVRDGVRLFLRLCVGDLCCVVREYTCPARHGSDSTDAVLNVHATDHAYSFEAVVDGHRYELGEAQTKYLSSEVAGGFTGVMIGLYAQCEQGNCKTPAVFTNFSCDYRNSERGIVQ